MMKQSGIANQQQNQFLVLKGLITGWVITQVIATLHVYFSNKALYQSMKAVSQAGYLPIPNTLVAESLLLLKSAFFGGFFYTLTIGSGLSILAIVLAWCWYRLFRWNKIILCILILLWVGSLIPVNMRGLNPAGTAYYTIVPTLVFLTVSGSIAKKTTRVQYQSESLSWLFHLIPIILLGILWWPQFNTDFFINFRDRCLLTNAVGKAVNDFYYTYTLYPAESFKSPAQKLIKTCRWVQRRNDTLSESLEAGLVDRDYLIVKGSIPVDLEIGEREKYLTLLHHDKKVLTARRDTFSQRLDEHLQKFSSVVDKHAFLRQSVFASLLFGFPLAVYIMIYALIAFLFSFLLNTKGSSGMAAVLCLLLGSGLLLLFREGPPQSLTPQMIGAVLTGDDKRYRISALKIVLQRGLDITDYQAYRKIIASRYIPERYWLAKAMGVSNKPETRDALTKLLNDPHPNVACAALYSLGRQQDKSVISTIIKVAETSPHWYVQWYAYNALKALGWNQNRSR